MSKESRHTARPGRDSETHRKGLMRGASEGEAAAEGRVERRRAGERGVQEMEENRLVAKVLPKCTLVLG
jgi:hypothetical protein